MGRRHESRATPRLVRSLFVIALAVVSLAGPLQVREVRAGACPGPQVHVYPDGSEAVPTNARVVLVFDAAEVTAYELLDLKSRQIARSGPVTTSGARVSLRDGSGRQVPFTLRRPASTKKPVWILEPRGALLPRSRYAVVLGMPGAEYVVARLVTGDGPDGAPPALSAVPKAVYGVHSRPKDWKDPWGRHAALSLTGVLGADIFEIHELSGQGPPSDSTLRAVVTGRRASDLTLILADGGPCHRANFVFPLAPRGARSHPLRLGVRALDFAGNSSPTREVTLDLARPR